MRWLRFYPLVLKYHVNIFVVNTTQEMDGDHVERICTLENCIPTKRIKDVRELKGLSIEGAADKLGLNIEELSYYEENPGEIPVSVAKKISLTYNVEYDCILFA